MWLFIRNRFETATRNNFRRMFKLMTDHVSRLERFSSDPEIQEILTRTLPFSNDFDTAYVHWIAIRNTYAGNTSQLASMMEELKATKIIAWDASISVVYPKGTQEYVALLHNGHAPFYRGSYEDRRGHVGALAEQLNNYPALSALQAEVEAFYLLLKSTRDNQQQYEAAVKEASDDLHKKRVALAKTMYITLATLMIKYANTPKDIERYFELELLQGGSGGEAPDDGEEPQEEVVIAMNSKQTTPTPVNLVVDGEDGTDVTANYGDGTTETKTESDSGPTVFSYLHSAAGNYGMQLISLLVGFLEFYAPDCKLSAINIAEGINLRVLDLMNNMLTSFFLPLSCVDMLNLQLNNNELDQASVNQVLMQLAANGLLNGSVNLGGGSNAAPSGQGIAAMNLLISRGWTVITN